MNASVFGEHYYANINKIKIDAIINALKENGFRISGNNPWEVDTHKHGIKLHGTWHESNSILTVVVTDKKFYVPCSKIWETIDPLIYHISSLNATDLIGNSVYNCSSIDYF